MYLSISLLPILLLLVNTVAAATETTCNGYDELCNRRYSNITYVGAHDSPFIGSARNSSMTNQDWAVAEQLDHGARMLQGQIHALTDSSLHLCHTNCFLHDGGALLAYLDSVKRWLDEHPRQVVTLLFTNSDGVDVERVAEPFRQSGLLDMAYVPSDSNRNSWPTLSTLIENNTRVVIFMDYHANTSKVPAILDEFDYIWEDAFNAVDASWPCQVDRGDGEKGMYLHNHYLDKQKSLLGTQYFTPDIDQLPTTNAATGEGSLGDGIQGCTAKHGHPPTFVLVDYESHGNGSVYHAAAVANGLNYHNPGTIHPPKAANEETNSSSSTSTISISTAGSLIGLLVVLIITI
ncbi:hypothetical protein E3P81_01639 [Wallemia ichthyophaga]|nr:hypothetical protein E3P97_01640 [Wallemia ichthyophaga]TIB33458.1 hypothetical protein E3P85_01292 [Wallemia ichthyophaga]TIB47520.1 hypothetical protein E3P82_01638 [Wallemia ichthyophaga]TIB51844.1 hypothetical protein E3P81_01639 [Wallemia ichthyophaga]TIB54524.1 hypothetical protein E3P80_01639 [Wallemia ichthyophaga]